MEAIATFGFLSDNIEDGVDELGTLGVVTLGPVVTGTGLAEHEVVWAEKLTERACAHGVHGTRLEIHKDRARHVAATGSLVVVTEWRNTYKEKAQIDMSWQSSIKFKIMA